MATVEQVNISLGRYYHSLNKPYNNQFAKYCNENGIDDEWFKDMMKELLSVKASELEFEEVDSTLLEFDDNFPFSFNQNPSNKNAAISCILKKCYFNPHQIFDSPTVPIC